MQDNVTTVKGGRIRSTYDAVVIGAGPAGCGTAASLANRGASVLLVESNPKAARRFAGEWIHPEGRRVLHEQGLLQGLPSSAGAAGFVVCANDGLGPIRLDYPPGDHGFACEHEALVAHLRQSVSNHPDIDYIEGFRARPTSPCLVELLARGIAPVLVVADRIVLAGGRSSRDLRDRKRADRVVISAMAGLLIRGAHLPCEGFGHVIVGGAGPALAYRIDDDRVRLCVDVPLKVARSARGRRWIWESFAEVLPDGLRGGVRRACSQSTVNWAANAFRPRSYQSDLGVALVGDAAGVLHPLTAMGITMSLLDAETLADARTLSDYASVRARQSYVPELLSNAIYQAFARHDAGAEAIREAMFRSWRTSASHRLRTMRLLGSASTSRADFFHAFMRVALQAGAESLRSDPHTTAKLADWLRWPLASVHPRPSEIRSRSLSWAAPESWSGPDFFRPREPLKEERYAQ
jgi:squalene monooxygenase